MVVGSRPLFSPAVLGLLEYSGSHLEWGGSDESLLLPKPQFSSQQNGCEHSISVGSCAVLHPARTEHFMGQAPLQVLMLQQ